MSQRKKLLQVAEPKISASFEQKNRNAGKLLVCLALLSGASLVIGGCAQAPPPPPQLPPSKVSVSYPIEQEVTDYVDFTGQTMAVKTVEVRARVWGFLQSLHFTEGALVKKGDLLFQIDPRPYQAAVNQAKGKIAQDAAQLKHTEALYRRMSDLRKTGAATGEDIDKALADRDAAKATLQTDQADLATKELDLEFTEIRAPITGRISRFEVTEGNVVQSGQNGGTLLTTIVSADPMYVYFEVDERTLLQVRRLIQQGQIKSVNESSFPIFLGLADEDGFPHQGVVNFLDNRVDAATGTLRFRAVVGNADGLLAPGLYVKCRLPLGTPHQATLVAEQSLGNDLEQKFVYVVNDANEPTYRSVKVGRLYDGMRVIEAGLTKKDKVVVNGLQRIRPGQKVDPNLIEMPTRSAMAKVGQSADKPAARN